MQTDRLANIGNNLVARFPGLCIEEGWVPSAMMKPSSPGYSRTRRVMSQIVHASQLKSMEVCLQATLGTSTAHEYDKRHGPQAFGVYLTHI
jgi:hypothetical protein